MKKFLIVAVVVLAFQMIGCSGNSNANEPEKNKTDKPTEPVMAVNNPKKEIAQEGIILLNKAEFLNKVWDYEKNPEKWVYKGDIPCLIDFYADWCGPCRMMAPVMSELAKEYSGKVYIYKIDIQKEKELASVFGIQSIPTFLIVPMNDQPQMHSGAGSKEMFKEIIEKHILKNK